jgi:hypothetical protein
VEQAGERRVNLIKTLHVYVSDRYGRYGALLTCVTPRGARGILETSARLKLVLAGLGNVEIAGDRMNQRIFYQNGLSSEF